MGEEEGGSKGGRLAIEGRKRTRSREEAIELGKKLGLGGRGEGVARGGASREGRIIGQTGSRKDKDKRRRQDKQETLQENWIKKRRKIMH